MQPQHILANTSASLENPTWRYYFNTSIADFFPDEYQWLDKFHGSDIALLFTFPSFDTDILPLSPQQYAVANSFRAALGRFIRNPVEGPGWPAVGSRFEPFGVANIGDLGAVPEGLAAGATPVNRTSLDERCAFYADLYPLMEAWMP
jgi:acetylcholinesterase